MSELWALQDVSFDVDAGQVIGVIGRNGAGKSTLLKILSRITEPTTGRVAIHGRVGSLLEVGTGFHQELSGRENIYLNGAILGMTRAEIGRKFDDIVAFSEIAEFLDTPVKRYSTGMFVRLAFAVAAHLEPEILLVDEVLSVGDLAFQRKCLGQMERSPAQAAPSSSSATTWAAVRSLCTRVVEIEAGHVVADGPSDETVSGLHRRPAGGGGRGAAPAAASGQARRAGHHRRPRASTKTAAHEGPFHSSQACRVEIDVDVARENAGYQVGFDLLSGDGLVCFVAHRRAARRLATDRAGAQHAVLRAPRRYSERRQRMRSRRAMCTRATGSSMATTRSGSTL